MLNYPLVQGIWYARARMIDQFGATSSWSDVRTFTVSHPPSATNLAPRDDSVLVYNASGTVFSWKFTDAYAKDVQTAYQVDIYDTLTQTLVVSTGKTVGSAQTCLVSSFLRLSWKRTSTGQSPCGTVTMYSPRQSLAEQFF